MPIELPSMPKFLVINISLIAAILLSALIGITILWQFTGILLEPPTSGQPEIALDISYSRVAVIGNAWEINGTAENTGNDALQNMTVILHSDGNIQGDKVTVKTIGAGETIEFQLKPVVKETAATGSFNAQLSITVPNTVPVEYSLEYSVSLAAPEASPEPTPAANTTTTNSTT